MFRSKMSFYLCLHICHILLKYSFLLLSPLGVQISLMYHEMAKYKRKETDEELMERFDSFVRAAVLEEGNKLRAEKGYPLLTEEDMADVDTLSGLKERFGAKEENR